VLGHVALIIIESEPLSKLTCHLEELSLSYRAYRGWKRYKRVRVKESRVGNEPGLAQDTIGLAGI